MNELVVECGAVPLGTPLTEHQRNRAILMGISAMGEGTVSLDVECPRDDRT